MAADPLSHEIAGADGEWARIIALVGPPGAGKSLLLRQATALASEAGARTVYVDLRHGREAWRLDEFYTWLFARLREGFGNGTFRSGARRLEACDLIGKALGRTKERVLLIVDHIESIADWCARELVSDVREIQDRSDGRQPWNRLRCVLAGVSSMFELRRRSHSPNLQFVIKTLPAWAPEASEAATRRYFEGRPTLVADEALARLALETGGEPGFLAAIAEHLDQACVTLADIDNAVTTLTTHACRYAELSRPASLYVLDEEFKRRAEDLLEARPADWCDPTADVDRYQLAGAMVCGDPRRREARFRNGLVERVIRELRSAERQHPGPSCATHAELAGLRRDCQTASSVSELFRHTGRAWMALSGVAGDAALLIGDRGTPKRFLVDATKVTLESVADHSAATETLDCQMPDARVRARWTGSHWNVDAELTRSNLVSGLRMVCPPEFVPTVAARELCRLWALFLGPLAPTLERLGLEALGRAALSASLPDARSRVFVSSTYRDLREHRTAVLEQIVRRDLKYRGMEHFGADSERLSPAVKVVEAVRQADVYLGIFGVRYGSRDRATGLSMTELELNEAESREMPMLVYVVRGDAQVLQSDIETDPEGRQKLDALVKRLKERYLVFEFGSVAELAKQVYEDLGKLQ